MHRLIFALLTLVSFSFSAQAAEKLRSLEITKDVIAQEYRLDNGLTVVLIENPNAPATSIYHWVKAGSLHERKGITGIAHLFEHMMFRPLTPTEASFSEKMKRLAGDINASTRFDSTVYNTTVPNQHLKEAIALEAARFQNLKVSDELLNVEREAVRSEYSTKFDVNPVVDIWFSIYEHAFPKHPYGWMIIGDRADLNKINAKDANEFYKKYYVPNNTGLFISGDFKSVEVIGWIEKEYGTWKKGESSKLPKAYKHKGGMVQKMGRLASGTPLALVGHRIPDFAKDNYLVMNLANHILYESDMALAKQKLVFDNPLVSTVSAFNFDYDTGLMKVIVSPLPGKKIKDIVAVMNQLPEHFAKMSDEDYEAYLREYRTTVLEQIQRNENLAAAMSLTWGRYDSIDFIAQLAKEEIKLPKAKVLEFVKAQLTPSNTVIIETKKEKK